MAFVAGKKTNPKVSLAAEPKVHWGEENLVCYGIS